MFQTCPPDEACEYCRGLRATPKVADIVDAVYCISIQEQPERFAAVQALFHAEGLCQDVVFYRPKRGRSPNPAIWSSHRAVAREALRRGQRRILVLEDDIRLVGSWTRAVAAARRAIAKLPPDWRALYLGHWPIAAYFAGRGVLRTMSGATHAYIANLPLLRWLDETEPMDPYAPKRPRSIGGGIDSAFSGLPLMFAVFPMRIVQRRMKEVRDPTRRPGLFERERYRLFVIVHGMRLAEWTAALLSPLHWLLMRRKAPAAGLSAQAQAEVRRQFDADYYLERYPDVAAAGYPALAHFVEHGAREGRAPNRWFDTAWYASRYPDARGKDLNPFEHYISSGKSLGYFPNADAAAGARAEALGAGQEAALGAAVAAR